MHNDVKPFTPEEIESVFLRAVHSFSGAKDRWQQRAVSGMTNDALHDALKRELGIHGGSGCRDSIDIAYEGSGLKIWASRDIPNSCLDEPILQGRQTMDMARKVLGIRHPDDRQMSLF